MSQIAIPVRLVGLQSDFSPIGSDQNYRIWSDLIWKFGPITAIQIQKKNPIGICLDPVGYRKDLDYFVLAPEECRSHALSLEEGFEALATMDFEAEGFTLDSCSTDIPSTEVEASRPNADSVWKSGPVRFFGQISTDRNRNRLPIMARPQITGPDRK